MTRYHIVVSIAGLEKELKNFKSKDKRRLYCYDVFGVDDETIYKEIEECKKLGYTVIPNSKCDNIGPDGSCLGHND